MTIGFTMMNVNRGAEYDVWQELVKISGVKKASHVFGEFDYVAIIGASDLSELNRVVDDIKLIQGVKTTRTCVEHQLLFMK
jgi:DNA-binding Lrp family transcriptional regulator